VGRTYSMESESKRDVRDDKEDISLVRRFRIQRVYRSRISTINSVDKVPGTHKLESRSSKLHPANSSSAPLLTVILSHSPAEKIAKRTWVTMAILGLKTPPSFLNHHASPLHHLTPTPATLRTNTLCLTLALSSGEEKERRTRSDSRTKPTSRASSRKSVMRRWS
jgi:hypothetical protein